jgi:flagellar motor switch/type III secretory pathway protein FliN
MRRFHPDLIEVCNQQVLRGRQPLPADSVTPATLLCRSAIERFSGQASFSFIFREQRWRVLLAQPTQLPQLHAVCWHALDPELRAAALVRASKPIQHWLTALLGGTPGLDELRLAAAELEGDLLLASISHSAIDCTWVLQAEAGASWASCLAGAATNSAATNNAADNNTTRHDPEAAYDQALAPLRLRLIARPAAVTTRELHSLEHGDFLVLREFSLDLGRTTVFTVSASTRTLTVLHRFEPPRPEPLMTSNFAPPSIGQLELDVCIQIAALPVRVDTLCRIGPGYTFMAPFALEGANVGITVDGQSLGRGRLISIGDVLGVQITDWLGAGSATPAF